MLLLRCRRTMLLTCAVALLAAPAVSAQDVPAEYKPVLTALGKQGTSRKRAEGQYPA